MGNIFCRSASFLLAALNLRHLLFLCLQHYIFTTSSILYSTPYILSDTLPCTKLRTSYASYATHVRSRSFMHNQPTLSHLARQYNQPIEFGCGFQAQTEQTEVSSQIYSFTHTPSPPSLPAVLVSHMLYKKSPMTKKIYHIINYYQQDPTRSPPCYLFSRQIDPQKPHFTTTTHIIARTYIQ